MNITENSCEKEMLKVMYENMIRIALERQPQKDPELYKKYIVYIISIMQSIFFTWCSSGDTSYFPTLFMKSEFVRISVAFLPTAVILVLDIVLGISAKRIRKNIDCHFEMTEHGWDKQLKKYVLYKWKQKYNYSELDMSGFVLNKISQKEEIVIEESNFANYLREYYSKYKLDVYDDFYNHLAKMIILDGEIKEELLYKKGKYIFRLNEQNKALLLGGFL